MASAKIKSKPTYRVSNLSIKRESEKHQVTASWKVPSGMTKASSSKRATSLVVEFRVQRQWPGKDYDSKNDLIVRRSYNIATTKATFDVWKFTDVNGKQWTRSDFHPYDGKPAINYIQVRVYGHNAKGTSNNYRSAGYSFAKPGKPELTPLEYDHDTGEIRFSIKPAKFFEAADVLWTDYDVLMLDTRTSSTEQSNQYDHKQGSQNEIEWNENTDEYDASRYDPTTDRWPVMKVDVYDRMHIGYDQYVRVRVRTRSRGYRGDSAYAEETIVVSYPNAATVEDPVVDTVDGAILQTGKVTIPIETNTDVEHHPTTGVRLQILRSTTATTAAQAVAMGEDWEDTDVVDDGECSALAMTVAELMPLRGTHTWVRVKSWNLYEDIHYRYSAPREVYQLYIDPASASDTLEIVSLVSGDDGTSLVADLRWTSGEEPDTGTELSWSSDIHAWESTREPETYEFTRNDGPVTIGGVEYAGTARVYIQGLEQGTLYYVKGRRYLDQEDRDRTYGGYAGPLSAIPVSSPTSVVLSAPAALPRGNDLAVSWTYDSTAQQTTWQLLWGVEYTEDVSTGMRTYTLTDAPLEVGEDATGACVIKWDRLASKLGDADEIGLAVRMGTGGSLVTSDTVTVRIVEPPTISVDVPATLEAQPLTVSLSCNVPASVALVLRAQGDGNTGDGLVHADQTGGDAVWQLYATPDWTEGSGTYTTSIEAPASLELLDNGTYALSVRPTDPDTGLVGDTAVATVEVVWEHQAPPMEADEEPTPIVVTPSDATDEDGVRTRSCEIALAPPDGALGTETYNVYRVTPDGPYLIAEGLGLSDTVTDLYAPYGGSEMAYRVAVVTADGDVDWMDYDYELPGRDLRIDFADEYVELPWNLSISDTYTKDFEARQKIDGSVDGYWNEAVTRTAGFQTDLIRIYEQDKAAAVRRLGNHSGPCFVRTPDGCAYQANVQVSNLGGARKDAALAVSLDVTEVRATSDFMVRDETESPEEEGTEEGTEG